MELLKRFTQGDLDAFEALFREFQGDVFRWIYRIVRDRGAAEDLTIETFWRVYRGRARFDTQRSFPAWARRIATNAALDYLRTRRQEVELPRQILDPPGPDAVAGREIGERIRAAFLQLSPRLRVTATLALVEDRPYDEIAEALGISTSAVKLRVFRATRKLRAKLKQWGVEP